jgi:anti-sigma factor RsiW
LRHVDHLLTAYHDGELPVRLRRQVEAHIEACAACRDELAALERLSALLHEDLLPDAFTSAGTFQAQVGLRLRRRAQSRAGYPSWTWHLVPLALLCTLTGLLGLLMLSDLVQTADVLLEWLGVDVAAVYRPAALAIDPALRSIVSRLQGVTWRLSLYLGAIVVFVSYAGWVGAIWRSRHQPALRKER